MTGSLCFRCDRELSSMFRGQKVGNLGLGAGNTVTFENVFVPKAGEYLMEVDSMTIGLRSYLYSVNGGVY